MRRWHRCQLFGRPVKPLAVALAVANATVAVTYLLDGDALGASHWADAAAVAAAVSVALLVAGFLDPRDRWTADGHPLRAHVRAVDPERVACGGVDDCCGWRVPAGAERQGGTGEVNDQTAAAIVGVAVYVAVRLVDYLLPSGRRFRWTDRYTREDRHTRKDEET